MDGDGPLDLRGSVAKAAADKLIVALDEKDDGEVFAAAHIAMDLYDAEGLGFEYSLFWGGETKLVDQIRDRVTNVHIAEEWGETSAREAVRRELLARLGTIEVRYYKEREARN
jgi:hypothetical protein